jgi:hypothetical protein
MEDNWRYSGLFTVCSGPKVRSMSTPIRKHKDHPPSGAVMRSHILNRQLAYFYFFFYFFLLSCTNVTWDEGAGSSSHHLIIIHTSLRQIFNGWLNKTVLWNARNHPRLALFNPDSFYKDVGRYSCSVHVNFLKHSHFLFANGMNSYRTAEIAIVFFLIFYNTRESFST